MTPVNWDGRERRKNDIYERLENLECISEARKIYEEALDKRLKENEVRLRDNEERIRTINRDIVAIKESQVATHKRITNIDREIKDNIKESFDKVDKNFIEIKNIIAADKKETTEEVKKLRTWKDNMIGAIKVVLGVPAVITFGITILKFFHLHK